MATNQSNLPAFITDNPIQINTPYLEDWIFEKLPPMFNGFFDIFENKRVRDIAFVSAIGDISAATHFVHGHYDGLEICPNLLTWIIGPSASGKSSVRHSRKLLGEIDNNFQRGYNGIDMGPFAIPGNNSSASIIQDMYKNHGVGLIHETEGDTVAEVLRQEWGNFSDVLRKIFHNEPISYSRVKRHLLVSCPKVGMTITMTPNQLQGLVKSRWDGLFGRVLFYTFTEHQPYRSPWSSSRPTLPNTISEIAERLGKWYKCYRNNQVEFDLSENQKSEFDEIRGTIHNLSLQHDPYNIDLQARTGIKSFKIMMTLSALRMTPPYRYKAGVCCKDDFQIAMSVGETLLEHSRFISNQIVKPGDTESQRPIEVILSRLPEIFETNEFLEAAEELQVPPSTAEKWLAKHRSEFYIRTSQGKYKKFPEDSDRVSQNLA